MAVTDGSVTVSGDNFSAESEFALVDHKSNTDWFGKSLEEEKGVLLPSHVEVRGNNAELHFTRGTLRTGNFDIFIRNPGGLWTLLGVVRVGHKSIVEWTFSFGYSPMFALFDIENAWDNYGQQWIPDGGGGHSEPERINSLDRFNPVGYYIRFGFIPVKTKIGNFGIEAHFGFLVDNRRRREWDDEEFALGDIFEPLSYGTFNLLYQVPMGERWQHNVRLGMGAGGSYHQVEEVNPGGGTYHHDLGMPFYFDLGYSAQYFIWKNLYFEAGLDLILAHNYDTKHNHFMIYPGLGIGWQMGRWAEFAEVAEAAARGEDYSVPVERNPKGEHLVSIGWAPMIPLSGMERRGWHPRWDFYGPQGYRGQEFLLPFDALGFNLHYAYIPYRWGKNKLGFDLELSMLFHKNWRDMKCEERYFDLFNEFLIGLRYQRVLNERWQLNGKIGIGAVHPYTYHFDQGADRWKLTNYPAFGVKLGASAQYFFHSNFYVEPSVDLVIFGTGSDSWNGVDNNTRFYLKPGISLGYQFRRNSETGLRLPGTGLPSLRGGEASEETAE
jgi:hypothetical protein